MGHFKTLVEDFKAWRRGERRIAPRNVSGRVYERKNDPEVQSPPGSIKVSAQRVATCRAKIIRADGSTEEVQLPAQVVELN